MSKHRNRIGKIAFGAAIVGALGFGAPSETKACTADTCTDPDPCDDYCTSHNYLAGKCMFLKCYCLTSAGVWVRPAGYPGDPHPRESRGVSPFDGGPLLISRGE